MVILWATLGPCSTDVDFGTSPWLLDQHVVGTSADFTEYNSRGLQKLHRAVLKVSKTCFDAHKIINRILLVVKMLITIFSLSLSLGVWKNYSNL